MNISKAANKTRPSRRAGVLHRLALGFVLVVCSVFSTGCWFLAGAAAGGAIIYAAQNHDHHDHPADDDHSHNPDLDYNHSH